MQQKYPSSLRNREEEVCPADLSDEDTKRLGELALKVHSTLKLGDYSRIDFMFDGNNFFCLEANTLPGMTPLSLLPQEAKAIGMTYEELCNKIIELAMKGS